MDAHAGAQTSVRCAAVAADSKEGGACAIGGGKTRYLRCLPARPRPLRWTPSIRLA